MLEPKQIRIMMESFWGASGDTLVPFNSPPGFYHESYPSFSGCLRKKCVLSLKNTHSAFSKKLKFAFCKKCMLCILPPAVTLDWFDVRQVPGNVCNCNRRLPKETIQRITMHNRKNMFEMDAAAVTYKLFHRQLLYDTCAKGRHTFSM